MEGGVEERAHKRARDDRMRRGKAGSRWAGDGGNRVEKRRSKLRKEREREEYQELIQNRRRREMKEY